MSDLPDHVRLNRAAWGRSSVDFASAGRRSWSTDAITWGIWAVPEAEVRALGDPVRLRGQHAVELGCGTAYFSAWLARLGMRPVGVDVTPEQLANARGFQREFGLEFPLIEASAEAVPLADASFDLALSEYGASIWCDPYRWIPEAARLLRPGGRLVFLRHSNLAQLCLPATGPAGDRLLHPLFGMNRLDWPGDAESLPSVEFSLPAGPMIRLMRSCGLTVEDLIEVRAPAEAAGEKFQIEAEWAKRWPSEEIWVATKG